MAARTRRTSVETPEDRAEATAPVETPEDETRADLPGLPAEEPVDAPDDPPSTVDVVAAPSLRADGTPDQTPGYVQL